MERQRMGILVCFFEASSVPVVAMVANLSDSQADKTAVYSSKNILQLKLLLACLKPLFVSGSCSNSELISESMNLLHILKGSLEGGASQSQKPNLMGFSIYI
jgi:hypothetical protein